MSGHIRIFVKVNLKSFLLKHGCLHPLSEEADINSDDRSLDRPLLIVSFEITWLMMGLSWKGLLSNVSAITREMAGIIQDHQIASINVPKWNNCRLITPSVPEDEM